MAIGEANAVLFSNRIRIGSGPPRPGHHAVLARHVWEEEGREQKETPAKILDGSWEGEGEVCILVVHSLGCHKREEEHLFI